MGKEKKRFKITFFFTFTYRNVLSEYKYICIDKIFHAVYVTRAIYVFDCQMQTLVSASLQETQFPLHLHGNSQHTHIW